MKTTRDVLIDYYNTQKKEGNGVRIIFGHGFVLDISPDKDLTVDEYNNLVYVHPEDNPEDIECIFNAYGIVRIEKTY